MSSSWGEFELIRDCFSQGFLRSPYTRLGVGDDCSIISSREGFELVQSIDTQVAGLHFPTNAPADLIAERALRAATSDLAAMGAEPLGFHLALSLPEANKEWLTIFAKGLKDCANEMGLDLLGGDTTRSSVLTISLAVQGWVPKGQALLRASAKVGDEIWVSNTIGRAALALPLVLKNPADFSGIARHYYFPQIQLELGQRLIGLAHACMDISDGLLQDAGHIARASKVTLKFDAPLIPTPVPMDAKDWWLCLTGGDDYQLLFTAPKEAHHELLNLRLEHSGLCCVGEVISAQDAPVMVCLEGKEIPLPKLTGFSHF